MKNETITGLYCGRAAEKSSQFYIHYPNGKRKFYATENERDDKYNEILSGIAPTLNLKPTVTELEIIRQIRVICEERRFSKDKILELIRNNVPNFTRNLHEVIEEFHARKKRDMQQGVIRPKSFSSYTTILSMLKRTLDDCSLIDFNEESARDQILDRYPNKTSVNTATLHLNMVLKYAFSQKYLADLRVIKYVKGNQQRKQIVETKDVEFIFENCDPSLTPLLALQWYAGVRPEASTKLKWKDIIFDENMIWIEAENNKVTGFEYIEHLPLKVFNILQSHRSGADNESFVRPSGFQLKIKAYRRLVLEQCGFDTFPQDLARHTFCSHLVALRKSVKLATDTMLHKGDTMTLKHYRRRVSHSQALLYFDETSADSL